MLPAEKARCVRELQNGPQAAPGNVRMLIVEMQRVVKCTVLKLDRFRHAQEPPREESDRDVDLWNHTPRDMDTAL